jgi:succinate dehydrogenase hydrophobic anchor subunit
MFASGAFSSPFLCMMAVLFRPVGVRNIAMDYIKPTGIRLTFQMVCCRRRGVRGLDDPALWGVL